MEVNVTSHPSLDATNILSFSPIPISLLYTDSPPPMMVSEVIEGRVTDSVSALCVPAERERQRLEWDIH